MPNDLHVAFLALDPRLLVNPELVDQWEVLDPILTTLSGAQLTTDAHTLTIRRGPCGVDGLCTLLSYFIAEHGLVGSLIEGKVERILEAMDKLSVHVRYISQN